MQRSEKRVAYTALFLWDNLRLRERTELGRAFDEAINALKDAQEGFIFRVAYFDSRPDLIFIVAFSKGVARPEVLERGLVLMRAAMAHYSKSRAMLIIDREGGGFEVSIDIESHEFHQPRPILRSIDEGPRTELRHCVSGWLDWGPIETPPTCYSAR